MDLLEDNVTQSATYNPVMSEDLNIVTMWYNMNGKYYDGRIHHRVRLEQTQEWTITHAPVTEVGSFKSHNWHLHGEHFQIVRAIDAHGISWSASPTNDWVAGDWRDIISVPRNGSVVVRWRPTLHTGLLLHHCHVYNHESAGLKEMIMVVNCSTGAIAKLNAHCSGNDVWPWAGQDCTNMCTDESMDMTG